MSQQEPAIPRPTPPASSGRVALVGAGPGEPGWITARGLELLRCADAVVYDALANPVLLEETPPHCRRIDAGKRAKEHRLTQDQTNQLLVDLARQGLFVVRLKGGDPYLFGRGAEEVAFLAAHGVACEVVPGITSGIAAPLAAGIPVTHRDVASTLTFVTGHEDPAKSATAIDYAALAALITAGGTACFYMSVARLDAIVGELASHGLDPQTPAAVVQWGSTPRQKSCSAPLGELAAELRAKQIGSPAIIVVGKVAAIRDPGLDFFTARPLFGKRVLITRTRQQASDLRRRLAELGADVLEAPTLEIAPPSTERLAAADRAIQSIGDFQWLVLTSINGVEALAQRVEQMGLDARHFHGVKVAAIGEPTAEALRRSLGLRADLVPTRFVAESLAAELIARHAVAGQRFLLLRADIARPALPRLLSQAGASVEEHTLYETRPAASLPDHVVNALRERSLDWITFTSSSTATNLVELLGPDASLLRDAKRPRLASIGPITSATLRELGLPVDVEAARSDIPGLVTAISGA